MSACDVKVAGALPGAAVIAAAAAAATTAAATAVLHDNAKTAGLYDVRPLINMICDVGSTTLSSWWV